MLGFCFGCSLEIMRLIKSFAVALDDFVPVSGRFYVRLPLKFVVVRSTI